MRIPSLSLVPVVSLAALMLIPVSASAQSATFAGVKGGVTMSRVHTNAAEIYADLGATWQAEDRTKLGVTAGVFVGRNLSANVGVQIEGLFSQRGSKQNISAGPVGGPVQLEGVSESRTSYVDIPLLFRFGTGGRSDRGFHLLVGATAGVKLSASSTFDGEPSEGAEDGVEPLDYGVTVGAEATLSRVIIEARYTHGLKNTATDDEFQFQSKNRSLSVMIGVRLK